MSQAAKIVIALLLAGFLLVVAGAGFAWWWWKNHGDELIESGREAFAEGKNEGVALKEGDCLVLVLQRQKKEGGSIVSAIRNNLRFNGCLETSQYQKDFCLGVPSRDSVLETAFWAAQQCAEHDLSSNDHCSQVFQELQKYCASGKRAKKAERSAGTG